MNVHFWHTLSFGQIQHSRDVDYPTEEDLMTTFAVGTVHVHMSQAILMLLEYKEVRESGACVMTCVLGQTQMSVAHCQKSLNGFCHKTQREVARILQAYFHAPGFGQTD